jgi:hypothetical protein
MKRKVRQQKYNRLNSEAGLGISLQERHTICNASPSKLYLEESLLAANARENGVEK